MEKSENESESSADDFDAILNYLQNKEYPSGMSKYDKRRLRQKSGCLKHRGPDHKLCRVITDLDEKTRIMNSLFGDPIGGATTTQYYCANYCFKITLTG